MAKDDLTPPREGGIRPAFYQALEAGVTNAGQEVIAANASLIQQFVQRQRTAVALGGLDQHRITLKSPDLDVEYVNVFGQERIRLTPRTVTVEQPPPIEIVIPSPDAPTFEEPTFEDVTTPTPCMLVLYKAAKSKQDPTIVPHYAAIPMSQLTKLHNGPTFGPIFVAVDESASFTQPVLTGQYLFGGVSFIHTDVDLSGKEKAHSCLCTTAMIDTVSMARQTLPIMNSPVKATDVVDIAQTPITLYTTAGVYVYQKLKLLAGEPNQLTKSQPHGIDQSGNLYYGARALGNHLSIGVDQSTIDQNDDLLSATLDKAEEAVRNYVSIYTISYVMRRDSHAVNDQEKTVQVITYKYQSELRGYGELDLPTQINETTSHTAINLYLVSAVVPGTSPPTAPPEHQNQSSVTELLGEAYYGVGQYGTTLVSIMGVVVAHDDIPYYDWKFSTRYYEYDMATNSSPSSDYSTTLYCMQFQPYDTGKGVITCAPEFAQAKETATHTIVTDMVQPYPEYGGNLILGDTVDYKLVLFDSGAYKGLVKTSFTQQDTIVGHSTNYPTNIGDMNPATLTYSQGVSAIANCIEQLYVPTCNPNGGPGPSGVYSGSASSSSSYSSTPIEATDENGYPYQKGSTELSSDTSSDDESGIPAPPGYKTQHVDDDYSATLSWCGRDFTGNELHDGSSNTSSVLVKLFPLHKTTAGYAVVHNVVTDTKSNETDIYTVITPYKDFPAGNTDPNFQPWMHLGNANHILQGFVIQGTPYIYLDDLDVTTKLATALKCKATDIAACYFDIDLDAIKLLGKVK